MLLLFACETAAWDGSRMKLSLPAKTARICFVSRDREDIVISQSRTVLNAKQTFRTIAGWVSAARHTDL
jgi:hypothetical protein